MKTLITGTSQGIGLELTRLCLEEGHEVMALARPSGHLGQLYALREQHGPKLTLVELELKNEVSLEALLKELKK